MSLKIVLDTRDAVTSANAFAKAIERVAKSTKLLGVSSDEVMRATKGMARRFGTTAKAAERLANASNGATAGMNNAAKAADRVDKSTKRAAGSTSKMASSMKRMLATYVGFRAVTGAVRTLAELEQGIVTLGTVTGSTEEELASLQATAVRVAQATKFTPKETTKALLELSRAGQSAALASESLIHVSNLAAAGVLDLGTAAGLTAATMAQFKNQSVTASEVAATFVAVADRTKSTVITLGSAMGQAGQAAAQFGINVEDTVIAIGQLQTAGIQASRSGRAIKTILSSLATANKRSRSRGAMEQMNLSAEDLIAKKGDLFGLFKRIKDATEDKSAQERVGILTSLVGKDFYAILAEAMNSVDEMVDLRNELASKNEELSSKAQKQNDTLSGSLLDVSSAYQEVLLSAGDAGATGALKSFFTTVASSMRILFGLKGALAQGTSNAKLLADAIKGIGLGVGLALTAKAVIGIGAAAITATRAMRGLSLASKAASLASPYTAVIAAVAAITVAVGQWGAAEAKRHQEFTARNNAISGAEDQGLLRDTDSSGKNKALERQIKELGTVEANLEASFAAIAGKSFNPASLKKYFDLFNKESFDALKLADKGGFQGGFSTSEFGRRKKPGSIIGPVSINPPADQLADVKAQALEELRLRKQSIALRIKERAEVIEAGQEEEAINKYAIELLKETRRLEKANAMTRLREAAASEDVSKKEISAMQAKIAMARVAVETSKAKLGLTDAEKQSVIDLSNLETGEAVKKAKAAVEAKKIAKQDRENSKARIEAANDRQKQFDKQFDNAVEELEQGEKLEAHLKEVARLRALAAMTPEQAAIVSAAYDASKAITDLGGTAAQAAAGGTQAGNDISTAQQAAANQEKIAEAKDKAIEQIETEKAQLEAIGASVGNQFATAFEAIASGSMTAKEAFKSMAADMIKQLIRIAMVKAATNFAMSFAGGAPSVTDTSTQGFNGANGPTAFDYQQQGGIIPAQLGTVISSPTTIQRGGRNYSISEGGGSTPEAVFPLVKNAKGQLGIDGGGGGGSGIFNISFPGIRTAQEARSAKRTMTQQISTVIAASEKKRNMSGMRPK